MGGIILLELLLGRSGTGKTRLIHEELARLAREKGGKLPLVLLVPEQASFESERTLLELLGPRLANTVQVLSFTRLAQTVFRETGGLAGTPMDDGTRALLMSRALEQTADRLELYRRQAASPAYIQAVLAVLTECKQCAITPRRLEETAAGLEDGVLRKKTAELALILEAYESLAAESAVDPLDSLTLLADKLPESRSLDGAYVFVDSFKGFTGQEMRVLAALMGKAERMTVALCADPDRPEEEYGLFSSILRTANRLRSLAFERNIPVAKLRRLAGNRRSASPALRALEAGAFAPRPAVFDGPSEEAAVVPCADAAEECAFTARAIRRLLREEGLRAREIAVTARNLAAYRGLLDAALEREGIPFYMDAREDILTEPLVTLALSALRIAADGWDTEELLRLLKTGLLPGFDAERIARLENYVYLWRIRGAAFKETWDWNPLGLSVRQDEESARQLAELNDMRRALAEPLLRLQSALRAAEKPDGRRFAQSLYRYLLEVGADEAVRRRTAALDEAGEPALADRCARLWDLLMDLLGRYAAALGDAALPPARHAELFRLAAGTADLGSIPQSLDAVQVGEAGRMRFSNPKAVFILGANEGVFPAYPAGDGLFSDGERRALIAAGLPMADTADRQAVEERFLAYAALSAPSERLYICYPRGNAAGETLAPSALVEMTRRILPDAPVLAPFREDGADLESEADAFDFLASHMQRPTPASGAVRELLEENAAFSSRLAAMERAAAGKSAAFADGELARRFFGEDMRLSPSRVEKYHLCRFAYFCQYGLKAKARRPADLDAAEFGTLSHYVMEKQLKAYRDAGRGFASLKKAEVFADAEARVTEYAETVMGGAENKPARFAYLLSRLVRTCGSLLWQVVRELAQSRFVPVAFELAIGGVGEEGEPYVEPVVLTLPDGAKIRVQGQVDRVDVYQKEGVSYVRVVDYKTGHKEFRLSDVVEGINLQMLIYILSICQNGGPHIGDKPAAPLQADSPIQPAGILYLPAKLPVVKVERGADEETAERERIRAMRMNGLLIDNPDIIRAMEADAAGLFIPARLGAKGDCLAGSSVASLEQFGQLKKRIDRLLCAMAETLRAGDVAAFPAAGRVDACTWCDYRAVCGRDPDGPARLIEDRDAADIWQELANDKP